MRLFALAVALSAIFSPVASAQIGESPSSLASSGIAAPELPPNDGLVTDDADVLTDDQDAALERALDAYQKKTGIDIAIVVMQTLSGSSPHDLAEQVRQKWSLGRSGSGQTIVILAGYESRDVAIDVDASLADALPPKVTAGLADKVMTPMIRTARYDQAFTEAIDALQKHLSGEYKPNRYDAMGRKGGIGAWFLLLVGLAACGGASMFLRHLLRWSGTAAGVLVGMLLVGLYGWWTAMPLLVIAGLACDALLEPIPSNRRHGHAHRHHGHR